MLVLPDDQMKTSHGEIQDHALLNLCEQNPTKEQKNVAQDRMTLRTNIFFAWRR